MGDLSNLNTQQLDSKHVDLQDTLQKQQALITSLQGQLAAANTAHHNELQKLRLQLQSGRSSPSSGAGLAEERAVLQRQVHELTDRLQQFSHCLAEGTAAMGVSLPNAQDVSSSLSKISLAHEMSGDPRYEKEALKSEIQRLDNQLKEVVTMNTRWQEHNTRREEYVQALQQKLKEMEGKLAEARKVQISEEQQQRIDQLIQSHKRKVTMVEEDKGKIEDENRHLRQELDQHRQKVQSQEQAILALQSQVESLQVSHQRLGPASMAPHSSREDKETIDMLKAQIQICTEDFQSERRDRERAHQKLSEMERELAVTKRQLEQYQTTQLTNLHDRRVHALNQYQNEFRMMHPNQPYPGHPPPHGGLVARGMYYADGEEDGPPEEEDGEDVVDCSMSRRSNLPSSSKQEMNAKQEQEATLQCPRCRREFSANRHKDLLEHIDICCD